MTDNIKTSVLCARCKCDIDKEIEALKVIEEQCVTDISILEGKIEHEQSVLASVRTEMLELRNGIFK